MSRMLRNCFMISLSISFCLYLLQAFVLSKVAGHVH